MFPLHIPSVNRQSKILGHNTVLVDKLDARRFEVLTEGKESRVFIKISTVYETAGPCEDGGNGVGRGLVAFLPFTVVTGDGT